jgi:hypothetical protein
MQKKIPTRKTEMKRSQSITLLAIGVTLTACSDQPTNYCDRSSAYYDAQKCDAQLQRKNHSYSHGGYVYHPWFRDNYQSTNTAPLSYGWSHNGTGAIVAAPRVSSAPAIGAARASGGTTGLSSAVSRGGFGSIGASVAAGGE